MNKKQQGRKDSVAPSINSEPLSKRHDTKSLKLGSRGELVEKGGSSLLEHFRFDDGDIKIIRHERSAPAAAAKEQTSNSSLKRKALSKSSIISSLHEIYSPSDPLRAKYDSKPSKAPFILKDKKIRCSSFQNLLPLVLLRKTEDCGVTMTTDILRQLTLKERVVVFNRKTGKIMRDEESISLKNLPAAIRNHAEYEIIFPEPSSGDSTGTRHCQQSRTSMATRIFRNIEPQSKVRTSKLEGHYVLVVDGPHKGLYGKIDSCLPGDWYLLSNTFDGGPLEVGLVVHSKHLKLINDPLRKTSVSDAPAENEESRKKCKSDELPVENNSLKKILEAIESLLLHRDALEEKRVCLQQDILGAVERSDSSSNNVVQSTIATHQDLEEELDRIRHQIMQEEAELQRYYFIRDALAEKSFQKDRESDER